MKKQSHKPKAYADDAPLTKAELATARPMREADPELVAAYETGTLRYRGRGRPAGRHKEAVTISLDTDVAALLRKSPKGWQTRVNDLLRAATGLTSDTAR